VVKPLYAPITKKKEEEVKGRNSNRPRKSAEKNLTWLKNLIVKNLVMKKK